MNRTAKSGSAGIVALVLLAGCAPVVGSGPFTLGTGPGMVASFTQCSPLTGSAEAARMGIHSPAIDAGAIRYRLQQLQSRFSFGFSAGNESWKRIASGEC
jgi:hypothetical protein